VAVKGGPSCGTPYLVNCALAKAYSGITSGKAPRRRLWPFKTDFGWRKPLLGRVDHEADTMS
jgi:hypothetical protein